MTTPCCPSPQPISKDWVGFLNVCAEGFCELYNKHGAKHIAATLMELNHPPFYGALNEVLKQIGQMTSSKLKEDPEKMKAASKFMDECFKFMFALQEKQSGGAVKVGDNISVMQKHEPQKKTENAMKITDDYCDMVMALDEEKNHRKLASTAELAKREKKREWCPVKTIVTIPDAASLETDNSTGQVHIKSALEEPKQRWIKDYVAQKTAEAEREANEKYKSTFTTKLQPFDVRKFGGERVIVIVAKRGEGAVHLRDFITEKNIINVFTAMDTSKKRDWKELLRDADEYKPLIVTSSYFSDVPMSLQPNYLILSKSTDRLNRISTFARLCDFSDLTMAIEEINGREGEWLVVNCVNGQLFKLTVPATTSEDSD